MLNIDQYPGPLDPVYEARLRGFGEGWAARQTEVDRANTDADRYYAALYNPRPPAKMGPSLAELERRRGNPERAARIEADLKRRFGDVA